MSELNLSREQIAFAVVIARKLDVSAYVLMPCDIFIHHFGLDQADQLKFFLSTNAWKIKLDDILQLVIITHDQGKVATWPAEDLRRQLSRMERRGVTEQDRK